MTKRTIKLNEDEQEACEILSPHMPGDLFIDLVKHRRAFTGAKLTARVARSLLREYQAFGNVEKAVEIQLTRGWRAFEASWVKQGHRYTDQHNPTPRSSANYGRPEAVKREEPLAEKIDPQRRAEMAARARSLIGRAMQ